MVSYTSVIKAFTPTKHGANLGVCRTVVVMMVEAGCEPHAITLFMMLNCCAHARPRNNTHSAVWFMEHVGSKHLRLSPQLEKAAQKVFGAQDPATRAIRKLY